MAGPWGGFSNGRIPPEALTPLSWTSGQRLRSDAAAAFEQLNIAFRGAFNTNIGVTDSYRDYATQVRLKNEKPNLAATPGTSNHGWALAVDLSSGINQFGSAQHKWMRAHAPGYGWVHPAWAQATGSKPEAWHWEFDGSFTNPTTPSEEDIMASIDDLKALLGTELASVVSQVNAVTNAAAKQGNVLILRQKNGQMVLVNGRGAHTLKPGEWLTLSNLGYTIDHDNMDPGPFEALVTAFGGADA